MAATGPAAVTGITEEELAALLNGDWEDDPHTDDPCWQRYVMGVGEQHVFPSKVGGGWTARHLNREFEYTDTLDAALTWCDNRTEGNKIAEERLATKQEDRFTRWVPCI